MFLNNLFLNISIAHYLLVIGFAIIDTTRKNATRLSKLLTSVKDKDKKSKKKEKRQSLIYNSVLVVIINFYLCFLW